MKALSILRLIQDTRNSFLETVVDQFDAVDAVAAIPRLRDRQMAA
jgi:hypothetical protein